MGAMLEKLDDGREVEIHKFDERETARQWLVLHEYTYERHEPWGFTLGFDFYQGPQPDLRATLRKKEGYWWVILWSRLDER